MVDAQAFSAAAAQHERLKSRWLGYEVGPHLQFGSPAMFDTAFSAAAAMIRAIRKTEQANSEFNTANYRSAVAAFGKALTVAEVAAGVTCHRTAEFRQIAHPRFRADFAVGSRPKRGAPRGMQML